MRPVTVQFYKNPDVVHWGFEALWLGEDEWGDWMHLPAGSRRWKGLASVRDTRMPAVFCSPRGEWWHLHYNGVNELSDYSHFIDIVTPPVWVSHNRYEMIDLDLDVAVRPDRSIEVQDEDEFEVHQVRFGYTEEMISRAVSETQRIVGLLHDNKEPFFDVAAQWLSQVR